MQLNSDIRTRLQLICERAESNLSDNLMPFWANHTWDTEYGGFLTRLDQRGRRLETDEKILIMQVRMIASLSLAHRFGLNDRGYLELAGKGFDFLVRNMWDPQEGGFYFSVTRDGKAKSQRKNTDFHAYAILGLTEYYRASGRKEPLEWAERVFDLLLTKAADRDRGFIEDFDDATWPVLNDDQMNLGGRQGIKTIDMHTNVMEAFMYLSRVTHSPRHLEALRNVVTLVKEKGIHTEHGCSITALDYDWNPIPDGRGKTTTSYGLNAEIAWLMLEAVDVLQERRERYRRTILVLVDHALEFGFDHERGGLAAYGPMAGRVTEATDLNENRLLKTWWAQAEMLNALVDVYQWTEHPRYLEAFIKLFDWIWTFQIDHEYGDWYQETFWDSGQAVTTHKGGEWKTAFHASRALVRVATTLRKMLAE
ncbi:MAG: AGE family epimerase/isomerase [Candidatus Hydrogenedentes bacterium]|nr:AGE family epimerase/isomerase [Candidatus Hydrogenedentota bacterium]